MMSSWKPTWKQVFLPRSERINFSSVLREKVRSFRVSCSIWTSSSTRWRMNSFNVPSPTYPVSTAAVRTLLVFKATHGDVRAAPVAPNKGLFQPANILGSSGLTAESRLWADFIGCDSLRENLQLHCPRVRLTDRLCGIIRKLPNPH